MDGTPHRIDVRLDELLARRGLTLAALAERVGVTVANLSVLKNGRARAIRFTTLTALCEQLGCQPGELLTLGTAAQPEPPPGAGHDEGGAARGDRDGPAGGR